MILLFQLPKTGTHFAAKTQMQTALEEFDHDDEALHDEELVSVP